LQPNLQHDDERFKAHLDDWIKGDFTQSDEQSLKILTDPDDFRREAVEGFAAVPEEDHAARLASIRSRLRNEAQLILREGRINHRYWAIAATMALLIGAFFFFRENTLTNHTEIAGNKPVSPADYQTDSVQDGLIAATQAPARAAEMDMEQTGGNFAKKLPLPRSQNPLTTNASGTGSPKTLDDADLASAPPSSEKDLMKTDEIKSEEQEDQRTKVSQSETVKIPNQIPPAPTALMTKPGTSKNLGLAKRETHRTEDKANLDSLRASLQRPSLEAQSQPSGGWDEWNAYLRQNARLTPEARNNNVSGSILLQFSINANGDPQNFFFQRRLGFGCDEEAVRLIRSWEWIAGNNNLVKLEIPFVR